MIYFQQGKEKITNLIRKYDRLLLLFVIFVASFVIRRIGLKFGFPLLTYHDEVYIIPPVYNMTLNRTLNSETFYRPDQILFFLNFVYLNFVSYIHFGKSLASTFFDNQQLFYFHGRFLICIFGSLVPIVAYKIGKEFKLDFSIPAALIFAFFPSYVIHSHYISPDVLITLFTLIIIFFTIKFLKTEKRNYLYLATFFTAVNTAEKYPGLISTSIIFMGVLLYFSKHVWKSEGNHDYKEFITLGIKLAGTFLLSLYLVAPNLFIHFGKVIDAISIETRTTHLGADNLGWLGNMLFYAKSYFSFINLIGIFLILFGIFFVIKSKEVKLLLIFYGIVYWIIISMLALHWERWALPMYITPNFLVAIGITYLIQLSKSKQILKYLSIGLIILFISHQFIHSLSSSIKLSFRDTRLVALEFCEDNNITSENSLFEGYTPFNPQFANTVFDYDYKTNDEIKHIIISSQMYQRYFAEPDRYYQEINFYDNLRENNELVYEISPTQVNSKNIVQAIDNVIYYMKVKFGIPTETRLNGPTIQIYKLME